MFGGLRLDDSQRATEPDTRSVKEERDLLWAYCNGRSTVVQSVSQLVKFNIFSTTLKSNGKSTLHLTHILIQQWNTSLLENNTPTTWIIVNSAGHLITAARAADTRLLPKWALVHLGDPFLHPESSTMNWHFTVTMSQQLSTHTHSTGGNNDAFFTITFPCAYALTTLSPSILL